MTSAIACSNAFIVSWATTMGDSPWRNASNERRLSYVTQWFPPEPVLVPLEIPRALRSHGWTIRVLTAIPNYPDGKVRAGYPATRPVTETTEGFEVRRTPLYPYHGESAFKRILNYLSWAVSSCVLGSPASRGADVALVYSSPATAALPALLHNRLFGTPFVLMIQDLWPDSVFASGFLEKGLTQRLTEAALNAFVNMSYRRAGHIVVTSPTMAGVLESRGVPAGKISLIYNWVDEDVYCPRGRTDRVRADLALRADDFILLYGGNHGPAQGLSALVEAVGLLPSERNCHAVLIGDGIEKEALQDLARRVAPGRVHFLDPIPAAQMPALMASADIQFVSLADRPLFRHTMPSKVQAALATGLPSIVAIRGDAADVVSTAGAGIPATPGDSSSIAHALSRAQDMGADALRVMGVAARNLYEREMSSESGSTSLSRILETVIDEHHARPRTIAQRERVTG